MLSTPLNLFFRLAYLVQFERNLRRHARGVLQQMWANMQTINNQKANFMRSFRRLMKDDNGASAIEYALIASLISILIIAGVASIGHSTSSNFNQVNTSLDNG